MRTERLTIGQHLTDTSGIYEITGFNEKGNTLCTCKEVIYSDEDSDDYDLGDEVYLTEEEVRQCFRHMTGKNVDKFIY